VIRKVFILGVLSLVTAWVFWGFISEAVLYNPLDELDTSEVVAETKADREFKFEPAWDQVIISKNIFSPLRGARPAPPKKPPTPKPAPIPQPPKPVERPPSVSLSGIILNQFGEYVAYLSVGNQQTVALRKGDVFEEVRVIDISQRTVKLGWRGETIELEMKNLISPKR